MSQTDTFILMKMLFAIFVIIWFLGGASARNEHITISLLSTTLVLSICATFLKLYIALTGNIITITIGNMLNE